jgi:hypothetical protein
MNRKNVLRTAPFALRVVQRKEGRAAIVYQRRPDSKGRDRLQRVGAISPLAFTASSSLLVAAITKSTFDSGKEQRSSVKSSKGQGRTSRAILSLGPFHPLDAEWGARVACYAIISSGLRDGEKIAYASRHMQHSDANEAAWWWGLLSQDNNKRALRALRIITEAVQ